MHLFLVLLVASSVTATEGSQALQYSKYKALYCPNSTSSSTKGQFKE